MNQESYSDLEFTTERIHPDHEDEGLLGVFNRHLIVYEWIGEQVRPGDRLLDLGAGEGYGSYLLAGAATAKFVVATDYAANAVAHANRKYLKPNLRFLGPVKK